MDKKKIGSFICLLRKEKSYTQNQLASKLYVDRGTISKWERGDYIPNPEILLQLSKIFNVSINEILAGERKNKNNSDLVDNVALEVIKEGNKKIRNTVIFSIFTIFIILIAFFIYYFFTNYNSISVYRLNGENDNFYVQDGLMVFSNEKAYIKINKVIPYHNEKFIEVKMYYIKDGKKNIIYSSDDLSELLINSFGYEELFSYKDTKYLLNNLYLDITTSLETETIKINCVKDFSNIKLLNINFTKKISDNNSNIIDTETSEYIKNNFNYNKEENYYYLKVKENTKNIKYTYFANHNILSIIINDNKTEKHYEYDYTDNHLSYSNIKEGEVNDSYTYDLKNNKCIDGNCKKQDIDSFYDKYLKRLIK